MSRQCVRVTLVLAGTVAIVLGGRLSVRAIDQTKNTSGLKPPVMLSNQEDRQRMLDLLKIGGIPASPGAYLASTYDEKMANPYPTLPDPLVMNDGTKVTTPTQWRGRRTEILELFDREVYGRRPKVMPSVTWNVVST